MVFQVTILGIFLIIIYRVQYIESIKVFLPLLNFLIDGVLIWFSPLLSKKEKNPIKLDVLFSSKSKQTGFGGILGDLVGIHWHIGFL